MSVQRQHSNLAALVLAANNSPQTDRFKPLMHLAGGTVVESAVKTFRHAGINRIACVTGYEASRLEPVLKFMGISAVRNPDFAAGWYSSVQAGIRSLPEEIDACLLLPVDVPLVRPATVKAIIDRYATSHPSIVYPVLDGRRGHPTLIARRLFAEILAGDDEGGLDAVLRRHQAEASEVRVFDEGILLGMDSLEDYERLAKLAPRRHLPTVAECDAILAALAVDDPIRRHGHAVAAVAEAMTKQLNAVGVIIDPDLVRAASLLHDIAKGVPTHAEAGAAILTGLGFPEVGDVIRHHMDLEYDGCSPREEAIVFLADKLVLEDRRVSLEEHFRQVSQRFRHQPEALRTATRKYDTALAILGSVERLAGKRIADIVADCGAPACPASPLQMLVETNV
jgi:putative nucleotidyltransferase with HDIG domain